MKRMSKMFLHRKVGVQTMQCHIMKILIVTLVFVVVRAQTVSKYVEPRDSSSKDLIMKGAKPEQPEEYLHTSYPISDEKSFIYKFEAIANAATVHHMILYGCKNEPFSKESIWKSGPICSGESQTILFAWAKNAPPTVLPKGVGVRIGIKSTVRTIVLQVHYARAFGKEEMADYSGIRIYTTQEEQPFVAGIFLMVGSFFLIPPGSPYQWQTKMAYPVDISCTFDMEKSIFPFAYRTHAHSQGIVITGYVNNGSYYQIGKGNPKWPQTFYPVHDKEIVIKRGDSVAARCTYDTRLINYSVSAGSTGKDEMCNFYIMFYTDSSVVDPSGLCSGNNIPALTGRNFPSDVSEPLPPNPDLEEKAKGNHHHGSMTGTVGPESQSVNTPADTWTRDLLMKGAKPDKPDAYLCAAYPVTEQEAYIYKFEAVANASTAHHILVYGCNGEPYSDEPFWRCPSMCKGQESTIMFAWAKNAPPTVLPKDVGLRIGQRSTIKTIVIQVHYARAFPADEKPDNSGIRVYITHKKPPFVAGIFFLGSSMFSIPPGQSSYPVDISCQFNLEKSIFPFAYRTHAHSLSRVITGYQFNDTYHQIGKGNPLWPQAFYPVMTIIEVKPGEYLAARCTYNSTTMKHRVNVGSTGDDEMCNFYIMFYTDNSVENPSGYCGGNQVTWLTGDNFPKDVSEPLPPNPELEEEAKGHHHNHHGGTDSDTLVSVPADTKTQDLIMKGAMLDKSEAYICTAYSITDLESYIYKFEAIGNVSLVQHMVVYACDGKPYSSEPVWKCPQKCVNGEFNIIWAWAKNTAPTVLPQGVGMPIGQQTHIKTIVLEVHYAKSFTDNESPDHSGIRIYTTQKKPSFVAGMFHFEKEVFQFPPRSSSYGLDFSCRFSKGRSIFPFLYMTRTHKLGNVVTVYHYNGSYHEILKGNPQWREAFYPVKENIEVKPGEHLAARCTYDSILMNNSNNAGQQSINDEICNIYIMFYTDSSEKDLYDECLTDSEPQLTGINFPSDVSVPLSSNPALEEEAKGIHFEHKLEFNSTWPSEKIQIGQIGGVATDLDGNVYIFHRGSREWTTQSFSIDNNFMYQDTPIPEDVIIVLNSQGQLVRKFGAGEYFMPHGIEVDKYKNIWITDVAMHQVFKIPNGKTKPTLVLGHRFEHGVGLSHFCKPTDVAVLSYGSFFVSDGYCNSRVLKFSREGALLQSWGEKSLFPTIPSPITFQIPHSITVSEENKLVCVADRENGQVQCFDLDGNFKYIIKHSEFGTRLFAIEQSPIYGGVLYAVNGPSFSSSHDSSVQGFTLDIKTGDILEIWNVPQHLKNPHDVCVHSGSQSVYIGELDPKAVWKISRSSSLATPDESPNVHVSMKPDYAVQNEKTTMFTTVVTRVDKGTFEKMSAVNKNISLVADKGATSGSSDIIPILIGCLLVVPVVLILIVILLARAHKTGKMNCCPHSNQVFSFPRILGNSRKGFDPINTEESDDDSDHQEYMAPKKIKK